MRKKLSFSILLLVLVSVSVSVSAKQSPRPKKSSSSCSEEPAEEIYCSEEQKEIDDYRKKNGENPPSEGPPTEEGDYDEEYDEEYEYDEWVNFFYLNLINESMRFSIILKLIVEENIFPCT